MQTALHRCSDEVRRTHGLAVDFRVGLNSGKVAVRAIDNDLHMDYSAIGQTVHLAACMEQLATPGSILLTRAIDQTMAADIVGHQVLCSLSLRDAQVLAGLLEKAHALAGHVLALAREHQERGHQAYALLLLGVMAAHRDPPQEDGSPTERLSFSSSSMTSPLRC
jgi:hypothetical protein